MEEVWKKAWKKRLDGEAVSPVIAVILMVAITVVLAAVLYVTVKEMVDGGSGKMTPYGSLSIQDVGARPGNYTATVIGLSNEVEYEDFYVTVTTEFGSVVLGSTTEGITGAIGTPATVGAPPGCNVTFDPAAASPTDKTHLSAGDVLRLNCGSAGDPWDGAEIKYVYIPSNGLSASGKIE